MIVEQTLAKGKKALASYILQPSQINNSWYVFRIRVEPPLIILNKFEPSFQQVLPDQHSVENNLLRSNPFYREAVPPSRGSNNESNRTRGYKDKHRLSAWSPLLRMVQSLGILKGTLFIKSSPRETAPAAVSRCCNLLFIIYFSRVVIIFSLLLLSDLHPPPPGLSGVLCPRGLTASQDKFLGLVRSPSYTGSPFT